MLVLHPFSLCRVDEQAETISALNLIRQKFSVINVLCTNEGDYDELLLCFWETEDLLVVEQDIVPTIPLIEELKDCMNPWCACWYMTKYKDDYDTAFKTFHGLGLTKISLEAQKQIPSNQWFKEYGGDNWRWSNLDSRISSALNKKGLAIHTHGEVKHNRVVDWTGKTR